jgi:hypothetical protein
MTMEQALGMSMAVAAAMMRGTAPAAPARC